MIIKMTIIKALSFILKYSFDGFRENHHFRSKILEIIEISAKILLILCSNNILKIMILLLSRDSRIYYFN